MKKFLIAIVLLVPVILAAIALWTWATIPPAPDPVTLPSLVLEPPSVDYQNAVEEGRTVARELIAEEKLPGLSLAVALDGEIVWAEGFRWADMEAERPVTPETLFRIGGISKAFTAAAVGLLSDRSRLDLDAPVRNYVPHFPEKEWPISTRQLMAHTAGITHHRAEGGLFLGPHCEDDAERLAIFADLPLRSRPGTEYSYSTYGWVLVGAVIAAAAEEPYLDFMQREVFAPLGMKNTLPEIPGRNEPGLAHFYYPRLMLNPRYGLHDLSELDLSCFYPAVGFLSTPSDLVRFGAAMMREGLLDPTTAQELQKPVRLESGEFTGHALGWTVGSAPMGAEGVNTRIVGVGLGEVVLSRPLSVVTVGGEVAGGTSTLLTLPDHGIAIAVTTNVSGAENVSVLAKRLADTFVRSLASR